MLNVGDKAPDFKLTTITADGPAHVTLSGSTAESVRMWVWSKSNRRQGDSGPLRRSLRMSE